MASALRLRVNGKPLTAEVEPETRLLEVLRDQFGLTGTKYGCGEGQCGACTVLIDGKPRRSCITLAVTAKGREVTTIEGLSPGGRLHPVQRAFLEAEALQCGYCTPGMIMSAAALLAARPNPTDDEILRHMEGNICRCGAYGRILAAVRLAAKLKGKSGT